MTSHKLRGRLRLAPISVNPHHGLIALLPSHLEPLAFSVGADDLAPDGLLVRVKHNGALAIWRGVRIEQVNTRKAATALAGIAQ